MANDALRAQIHAELDTFLDAGTTRPEDTKVLLRFLLDPPPEEPTNPLYTPEQVEERLSLARQIKARRKALNENITTFDLSVLFALPLPVLQDIAATSQPVVEYGFFSLVEKLVRIFLQMSRPEFMPSKKVARNKPGSDMCLQRSNSACIFLHTAQPEVCHIFPFAANATKEGINALSRTGSVLRAIVGKDEMQGLLLSSPGCSDECWNMLPLNRQLYKWWSLGLLALRCLGVLPVVGQADADIKLQFYWLPRRGPFVPDLPASTLRIDSWNQTVHVDTGEDRLIWEEWSKDLLSASGSASLPPSSSTEMPMLAAALPATGRALRTGTTATLRMPVVEAYKMKAMVDVQWACLMIASMSGAAGSPQFLELDDNEDEDASASWGWGY